MQLIFLTDPPSPTSPPLLSSSRCILNMVDSTVLAPNMASECPVLLHMSVLVCVCVCGAFPILTHRLDIYIVLLHCDLNAWGAAFILDLNKTYITLCDITIHFQST